MARQSLDNGVKFKSLVHAVGMPRPFVRGLLQTLWDAAHATGNPVIGAEHAIEIASEWPGEHGKWFAALRDGGWIEPHTKTAWRIHDYYDNCPDFVLKRHARINNLQYKGLRESLSEEFRIPKNSQRTPKNSARKKTDSLSAPICSAPLLSDPIHESPNGDSCSATPEATTEQPAGVVMIFPTVGDGPKEWPLTEAKAVEYRESFPGVDVMSECRKARQWCIDNPAKRKTAKGMPKFLSGWLGRAQDRAGAGRAPPNTAPTFDGIDEGVRRVKEALAARGEL